MDLPMSEMPAVFADAPRLSFPCMLDDGVYFGMPDAEYHAIPRFSTSGIKDMRISPLDFWWRSFMNPDREPDTDSPAKKLGRAYHKLLLEGEEAFDATYAVAPSKDDYPDALDGADALKSKCDELGLKKTGRISDLCERIREADPAVQLWPDIMEEFQATAEGREVLTLSQWQEIQRVRFVLKHLGTVKQAFTGGYPEVTILWTDEMTGVPMKCRMDYLKPRGDTAGILDVKSFGNVMDKPIEDVPTTEIGRNCYFIQPVSYIQAWKAAAKMWQREGMACIHGAEPPRDWLNAVFGARRSQFHFVFVQTGGVPNIIVREFVEADTFGGMGWQTTEHWKKGMALYRNGTWMFRRCFEQYGADRPWIADYGVKPLKDEDFAPWQLDYRTDLPIDEAA